ncbi:hypothetical protein BABINDRAFT_170401 [Babjeviella inositovora NRRL Y-12698]|uniref:Ubiquitin-activating enzyme E1-like n=1 Tax=Babjeviella inositovora NRRL Y-12698 TaxID=984486 RepID=A0A1E3QVV6_9ASCO|nr:uncharacterized protein BABINDRAFT_170401 [Babjeviella inositovora NRRL Y-12698]ODQ81714.1 hypothetical protein BABINDRAFT_170401 [Babjeviella inositovora NRRL Y-12698]
MTKDTYINKVLAKVLMVGAGGIGCELLKDLILMGYGEIHIVDLDTISLSNLNRQFLFRHRDIDKSKSLTVVNAVQPFNFHGTQLVSYHGSIMDAKLFTLEWFDQFSIVFNALDNIEARAYVNRICLFLRKLMMESGTTGFNGQVQPIFPYRTECFDCTVKETPKTFPVCTIRSTPSKPVHCITWAKDFLFAQLFNDEAQELSAADLSKESDNASEIATLLKETNELAELKAKIAQSDFVHEIVDKIFRVDIERLLLIDALWKTRTKPEPFRFEAYEVELGQVSPAIIDEETTQWSVAENLHVLMASILRLQARINSGKETFVSFDKDDEDTLNFVTAASNIRSFIFLIPIQTKFDLKQIAGNIIPAIATTNAIIAGFSALQSLNIFGNDTVEKSRMIFTSTAANKFVITSTLASGSPKCPSCSITRGIMRVGATQELVLSDLVGALKTKYGYAEISLVLGKSKLIYDCDFDDSLDNTLHQLGFVTGEVIQVNDEDDELESIELYIEVLEADNAIQLPDLVIGEKKATPRAEPEEEHPVPTPELDGDVVVIADEDDDDDLMITNGSSVKRKHEEEEKTTLETPLKKTKLDEQEEEVEILD